MKTAVIYKSTYGTAKAYAAQIAQELGADLLECGKAKPSNLTQYDSIVFGGGIYAGRITGSKQLRNLCVKLPDKLFIVFSVGFTPGSMTDLLDKVRADSLRGVSVKNIRFFHFTGGIDCKKLKLSHKLILSGIKRMLASQPEDKLTEDNKRFLAQFGQEATFALDSTDELVACLKD